MAQGNLKNLTVRIPVLDRLIDDAPDTTREPPLPNHQALRVVIEAVRRDLQDLLNSRQAWVDEALLEAEQASRSILAFGLPEFTMASVSGPGKDMMERLRGSIEDAIARFEPRLVRVVVSSEPMGAHERRVRFRIDAYLRVDPVQEPVTFDTVLHAGGEAEVTAA